MRIPIRPLLAVLVAAILGLLAHPPRAAAQTCISCGSPPTITITPSTGSWTGTTTTTTQAVSVKFCQTTGGTAAPGDEYITLDGNGQSFTDGSVVSNCWTATGNVVLSAGSHTLTASVSNNGGTATKSATYTYTISAPPPTGGVTVLPHGGTGRGVTSGGAEVFVVRNTDTQTRSYTLSALCSGGTLSACVPGQFSLSLAAGDSARVPVTHAGAGGTVYLKAWRSDATTARDSGWTTVSTAVTVSEGLPNDAGNQTTVEKSMCVKLPAGAAIFECGDLRLVQALPGTRVLNRARQPMLVYSSQQASPHPIVATTVSNAGGTVNLTLQFTSGTTNTYTAQVTGTAQASARVGISFDATGWPTGIYDYTLSAAKVNADGSQTSLGSTPGTLAIVDGYNSSFGSGWSVAGMERIVPVSNSRLLWVDGDGSTRLYLPVAGTTTKWSFDNFDRPDTIVSQASGGGWKRVLPGGDTILFDFAGRDTAALNALGQHTAFRYDGVGKLTQIVLPGNGQTSSLTYDFAYTTAGVVQSITAPTAVAGQASSRITQFVSDANGRITKIVSPDVRDTTVLGYSDATGRLASIRDARHFTTSYAYDGGSRLGSVSWTDPATNTTASTIFSAAESRGLNTTSGLIAAGSVRTVFNGPRTEVSDVSTFYVNRYGAPIAINDALGASTQIAHADPTYAALGTQVTYPNGRKVTANYDAAGHLVAQTDWGTVSSDGRYATTTYDWDPKWESVTRETLPEGETTYRGYDSYGRLSWVQQGSDAARRTTIQYRSPADSTAPGLPDSTSYPQVAGQPLVRERYQYDARGNLSSVRSPMGFQTSYLADAAGQVLRVTSPLDSAQTTFRVDSTGYDVMGRVTHTEARSPVIGSLPDQKLTTDTQYGVGGLTTSITRTAVTSGSVTLAITTTYRYDAAGRKVAEIAPDSTPATLADNPVDSTAYDVAGNVTAILTRRKNASGAPMAVRMTYDELNRLKTRIADSVRYSPRTEGIAAQTGMVTDPAQNPPYPRYPNDGAGGYRIASDTTLFDYDPVTGSMLSARNPFARVSRTYAPNGAVVSETDSVRTWADLASGGTFAKHVYALGWEYDLNGRRTAVVHPTQLIPNYQQGQVIRDRTTYAYDRVTGALSGVTDVMGNTFRIAYDVLGQPDSVFLPGGVNEIYDYDPDGRLVRHRVQNTGTSLAHHFPNPWLRDTGFRYDAQGKLLSTGNAFLSTDTLTASYSGMGHLVSSRSISHGIGYYGDSGRSDDAQSFTYDALGNQTSMSTSNTLDRYLGMIRESSTSYMGYETGTGRLLKTYQTFLTETNQYDLAGNLVFASGDGIKSATLNDRALFYSADGQLRAADFRKRANVTAEAPQNFTSVFEEYRYDPLGRRVAVWTRRWCELPEPNGGASLAECRLSTMRRTVWDGSAELGEFQMPGAPGDTLAENDINQVPFIAWNSTRDGNFYDQNTYFGRVVYAYGLAVDQPLSVIRIGLSDAPWNSSTGQQSAVTRWPAFAFMPLWTHKGGPDLATFADGSAVTCVGSGSTERCIPIRFPLQWFAYARSAWRPAAWWGTLVEDKQDRSGLSYRRNRYYDPDNGRFTQEDPAGLAGGLNLYGFAGGNPVNFDDPFGLCPVLISAMGDQACIGWDEAVAHGKRFLKRYIDYEIAGFVSGADPYHRNADNSGRFGQMLGMATFLIPSVPGAAPVTESITAERGGVVGYSADGGRAVPGHPFTGANAAQDAFAHLERYHGLDPHIASNRLHRIKAAAGLGAADNAIIGRTGDVFDPRSGEMIGSLTDPNWGGVKR